jgi:alkanesulfonate monooxygenase SsuD/methylene tetrahydromethanopterin reductase-like flavin-dependent oxidoreductase (luciferase family)
VIRGTVYDPVETLTYVAALTSRITLGTSVLDALFQSPVILARRLATLDRFSGGRLIAGIGQGWVKQEFQAAGVSMKRRGAGFEEHLLAMRAVWVPTRCTSRAASTASPRPTSAQNRSAQGAHASWWAPLHPRRSTGPDDSVSD